MLTFVILDLVADHQAGGDEEAGAGDAIHQCELPHKAALAKSASVLVVDDEAGARDLVSAILAKSEAEVKTAGSVSEALAILNGYMELLASEKLGSLNER